MVMRSEDGKKDVDRILQPFRCGSDVLSLQAQGKELAKRLAGIVSLGGENPELMALMTALVHCCTTSVVLPTGRRLKYGPLQGLVIGESGSYKSTCTYEVAERIGLAETASSDAATRAGLLYKLEARTVKPGLLPRNHGRCLILDEFHKIRSTEVRAATFARGSGCLKVHGCSTAEFPMQTRFLAVGNLTARGSSGWSSHGSALIGDFDKGICGAGFLEMEDLRRFDFVMVVKRIAAAGLDRSTPDSFVRELRALIELYWELDDLQTPSLSWEPQAFECLGEAARRLNEKFETPRLPLCGPDTADKVARLATAAARLMPAAGDLPTRVFDSHVLWAARLLESVYEMPSNGLGAWVQDRRQCEDSWTPSRLNSLCRSLSREMSDHDVLLSYMKERSAFTTGMLASAMGCSVRKAGKRVRVLKQAGIVTSHGCEGLRITALGRKLGEFMDLATRQGRCIGDFELDCEPDMGPPEPLDQADAEPASESAAGKAQEVSCDTGANSAISETPAVQKETASPCNAS